MNTLCTNQEERQTPNLMSKELHDGCIQRGCPWWALEGGEERLSGL